MTTTSVEATAHKGMFDWPNMCKAPTELLAKIDDPLHVAIVQNYRRHVLLENGQRFQEIFTPEMMVEVPVYLFSFLGINYRLEGRNDLHDLYSNTLFQVFQQDECVAVNDWGICTESYAHQFVTGTTLKMLGKDFDKEDDRYIIKYWQTMIWHYTDRGIMIGENVYGQQWSEEIVEAPPDEPTEDEVGAMLQPVIAQYEQEWRDSLLV